MTAQVHHCEVKGRHLEVFGVKVHAFILHGQENNGMASRPDDCDKRTVIEAGYLDGTRKWKFLHEVLKPMNGMFSS